MSQELTLQLGQLSFHSPQDPLRLSSKSSFTLSHSEQSTTHPLNASLDLEQLKDGAVWIGRGAGLRFEISIYAEEGFDLDGPAKEAFIENVGAVLKNAEVLFRQMWSQLLLDVSLSVSSEDGPASSRVGTICLSLVHQNGPLEAKTAFLKGRKLIPSNVGPPHGLFSGSLREITVELSFSFASSRSLASIKRRRMNCVGKVSEGISLVERHDEILDDANDQNIAAMHQGLYSSFSSTEQSLKSLSATELDAAYSMLELSNSEQMLDVTDWKTTIRDTARRTDTEKDATFSMLEIFRTTCRPYTESRNMGMIESIHSANDASTRSSSHFKKRVAELQRLERTSLDLDSSVKLLDAMFRRLICGNELRLCNGIKHNTLLTPAPALSEVSPVLFSPGYLPAIAQRSQLLSRIANSIAAISCRSKNKSLQASFGKFLVLDANKAHNTDRVESEDCNRLPGLHDKHALSSELHRRLWKLTQLSLFDRSAAKRLKPLKLAPEAARVFQPEMLDRPSSPALPTTSTQTSSSSLSQMDANLFSDEEDCSDRSMLDEVEFFDSATKDKLAFPDLFEGFDVLDEEEERDLFLDDWTDDMLEYEAGEEDEMIFSDNEAAIQSDIDSAGTLEGTEVYMI